MQVLVDDLYIRVYVGAPFCESEPRAIVRHHERAFPQRARQLVQHLHLPRVSVCTEPVPKRSGPGPGRACWSTTNSDTIHSQHIPGRDAQHRPSNSDTKCTVVIVYKYQRYQQTNRVLIPYQLCVHVVLISGEHDLGW